jgi:integrase
MAGVRREGSDRGRGQSQGATWDQAGPLFRKTKTSYSAGDRPLHTTHVAWIIKERCRRAGIEGITGHSLRVGGAQTLAAAGMSLVDMQLAGRWASPSMPARYARGQMAGKTALAKLQAQRRARV